MERFECLFCKKKHPFDLFNTFCPECGEPMLVASSKRKRTIAWQRQLSLEKFRDFLPLASIDSGLSLGEGNTPLVPLERISERYGLQTVWAKNETMNPTHSFKDRGSVVVIAKAVALGIRKIGTVSTGNMASSTAAYAAKAGLESHVFLKEDTSLEKILAVRVYGARVFRMKGDYGKLFWRSFSLGRRRGIYFANSVDPLRLEGYKTTAYEIFLSLDGRVPRFIFIPVSSGGNLIGTMRGFFDLREEGLVSQLPIFVGVQARGCSPLVQAFWQGREKFERIAQAKTIAHAISNPDPPAGNLVLKLVRETGGLLLAVTDNEILKAQKELAELEGIFADPASATTLAALIKIRHGFHSNRTPLPNLNGEIVLIITGSGLKTLSQAIPVRKWSQSIFLGAKMMA